MIRLVVEVGQALYGERWQSALAADLDMSDRHMRRLAAGTATVTAGIEQDLRRLCEERRAQLGDILARLDAAIGK